MQTLRAIAGPAGGLGYHITAWRFYSRWEPFRERLRSWLNTWNPREKRLVLFGPSAGYSLSKTFLERFDAIDVIEPDPVARYLFNRRFSSLKNRIHFFNAFDILPWWQAGETNPEEKFESFLSEREAVAGPGAVLFANFLGQLPLLKINYEQQSLRDGFLSVLSKRNWASYHDLFSGRSNDLSRRPDSIVLTPEIELMARRFFRNEAEVIDHGTTWLGQGRMIPVCHWELTPKNVHVIAFISHART